jgi:hypothetical protein
MSCSLSMRSSTWSKVGRSLSRMIPEQQVPGLRSSVPNTGLTAVLSGVYARNKGRFSQCSLTVFIYRSTYMPPTGGRRKRLPRGQMGHVNNTVAYLEVWLWMGYGLDIGFITQCGITTLSLIYTLYDSLGHAKSSQSLLVISLQRSLTQKL